MFKKIIMLCLVTITASESVANIIILGTRQIFPSDQKTISVQLNNVGNNPALVQSWIDDGDIKSQPETSNAPFIITPPIVRMEANTGQTLRVTFTGKQLPKDRETVYYLNVLDIPPKPTDAESVNYLQFSIRSRIKLFYRPTEIAKLPNDLYQQAQFRAVKGGLKVTNPTPYYISYEGISINGQKVREAKMVAPFSSEKMEIGNAKSGAKVKWSAINDYGGSVTGESILK